MNVSVDYLKIKSNAEISEEVIKKAESLPFYCEEHYSLSADFYADYLQRNELPLELSVLNEIFVSRDKKEPLVIAELFGGQALKSGRMLEILENSSKSDWPTSNMIIESWDIRDTKHLSDAYGVRFKTKDALSSSYEHLDAAFVCLDNPTVGCLSMYKLTKMIDTMSLTAKKGFVFMFNVGYINNTEGPVVSDIIHLGDKYIDVHGDGDEIIQSILFVRHSMFINQIEHMYDNFFICEPLKEELNPTTRPVVNAIKTFSGESNYFYPTHILDYIMDTRGFSRVSSAQGDNVLTYCVV